ncbi:hypothetical protein Syun_010748 [Stephania yunnanensis]|uniref:Uncharacterized protein n=1 Tax=Stephania yunnanensis TaxID=152371 RepID=A0AAP0PRZ2_9MAGN
MDDVRVTHFPHSRLVFRASNDVRIEPKSSERYIIVKRFGWGSLVHGFLSLDCEMFDEVDTRVETGLCHATHATKLLKDTFSYPPSYQQGPYVAPPPPVGYPVNYSQQPTGPVETKSRGDGFWKGWYVS